MISTRLSRYIFWQTLMGVVGAACVIIAVIILIDFVETSRDISRRADVGALQALELTLLKTPKLVQDTLAFIVLFGVLFTFFRLNRRSELIVMRASGYSAWRILAPAGALTLVAGLLGAALLNPLSAATNARFETLRAQHVLARGEAPSTPRIWLRETTPYGFVFIGAQSIDPDASSLNAPVFRFFMETPQGAPRLERTVFADQAELRGGFWALSGASEAMPGDPLEALGEVSLPTSIGAQALFERVRSPEGVSFWRLPGVIDSAREAGLSSRPYELRWQSLMAQPLLLFAAALLAIGATLRLHRLGGAAAFAAAGAGAGFLLFFSQALLLGLGEAGTLGPITAAWTTPALFTLAGLFFIATTEDG
ncbi:LptF/LptG family permease [Alkalicaulis satelles]|uniref:LptF/LptG family permease n=1 Tax=Alkalicaulis satelles TaxID=2609175 RepID=A0A5M6ZPI1_9PROT|nr:LptF/LptG family permease [Alkalicaulis satelles]KAA5805148.1 LptF/LptG family permease [Alkalicaulis satelles]